MSDEPSRRPRVARALQVPLLLVVGLLLAQGAWLLAVPAFRGIDEFDHVYRAASVARGEWLPGSEQARDGRGGLVTVPRDLVAAAGPECSARPYTGRDNCHPVSDVGDGQVRVASAASRYQPVYYWVVGTAARWADGTAAVYAMRVASALLCALFLGLSAWTVGRWARTRWPMVALVGSLTPVVAYSATVVAPNALEVLAGTSVWVALAGLGSPGLTARTERTLLLAAVPGALVLATVRSLGTGFLGLTVLVVLALLGRRRATDLVRRHRGTVVAGGSAVLVAVAAGIGWLLLAAPNRLEVSQARHPGAVGASLVQLPVWVLQTVAAAPGRTDPAPGLVYLLCGGLLTALSVLALRAADPRLRSSILLVAVASLALPFVMTLRTYAEVGVIWQGRYGLPFSVGVLVLGALSLDRRTAAPSLGPAATVTAVGVFAVGQVVAVLHVLREQSLVSPSVGAGLWTVPSPWLVGALAVLGWALLGVALLLSPGVSRAASCSPRPALRPAARGTAPRP